MDFIIKPNWDIFKAKFSENPQSNFEWVCYLLFCKEYKQEKGIFRYKNQSAIETNTISVGDEIIGWQAKFYDTTLSSNKSKLIETLELAKRNYKGINKLIFYTNQEWGQCHDKNAPKENDTKAKKEVEDKAKELGIDLLWRTASFFESPFVVEGNKEIAKHFFTLEESIIDRLNKKIIPRVSELNEQYKNTFRGIKGTFINRPEIDKCIEEIEQNNSLIIHGKAGQGKSGCTQGVIEYCETEDIPYIAIKLDDRMPEQNADKWGEDLGLTTSIPMALNMLCENKRGVIILDQLDALRWTNAHSRQALITCTEVIKRVEEINFNRDNKISIIFVCRTYDYENDSNINSLFKSNDKEKNGIVWNEVIPEELSEEVVRMSVGAIIEDIKQDKSVIIHGKNEQAKSRCTKGVIEYCKTQGIHYVTIKSDDIRSDQDIDKYKENLDLRAAIPMVLDILCENKRGVVILDELLLMNVDSSRDLIICTEVINKVEEINLSRDNKLSIIFVCRSDDYENNPIIKELINSNNKQKCIAWKKVIVEELAEETVREVVGAKYDNLSLKMKKVLSFASNLYIWTQLEEDRMYDDYSTTNQLVQKWWEQIKKNCIDNQIDEVEVEDAKSALINKINTLGKLHISIKLLSALGVTERSLTYLSSNGFIVGNSNSISFAHQSISDYFLAQEMFKRFFEGEDIISIIGDKDKQTPQKRYQIQMLLQDIQTEDEEVFIKVGIQIMKSNQIRFYVKYVFFEVIGQAITISDATRKFILKYYDDYEYGNHIIDGIIVGHAIFVQLLIDNGILDKWMSLDDKKDIAIKLVQSISPKYRNEDIEFIKRHLFKSKDNDEKFSRCFSFNIYEDIDEMFELRLAFYEKYPKFIDRYIDFKELFIRCELRALRIFEFVLKNELKERGIYQEDDNFLDNDNEVLIENVELILDTLLVYIPQEEEGWYSKWNARESYNQGMERTCVEIIKKANRVLIKRNPEEFIYRYKQYFNKGYNVYNEIILDGLKKFPTELSNLVINCLYDNFDNIIFDKSSSTKNKLDMVKDVIEVHSRWCDNETYLKLEEEIIYYIDPRAKEWYKRRIEFNRDKSNNTKVYWSFWGDLQIMLLPALPKERISLKAKKLLDVLKRRNISFVDSNIYNKNGGQSGSVYSPIAGKRLSNKQWVQILTNTKIKDKDRRSRWVEVKGGFVESSIEEFASELRDAVSKEPERFINLILDNSFSINDVYVDALFSGITYSENLEEVNNKILERLILTYKYDYEGYRAKYICDMVRKKDSGEWSYEILDILKDIALNHINPKIDEPNVTSPDDNEMKSFNMLSSNALNCVRGSAASAIGKLLWDHKTLFEYFEDSIIQLCQDENPAVRLATLDILFPVYNINRGWAIEKIINILKSDYRLAGYRGMKQMFFLTHNDKQDEIENIILKCFYEEDKDLLKMGAYTLAEMYIVKNRFTEVVENVESLNQEQVKHILEMVIIYFNKEEYNELAKELIMKYVKLDLDLEFPISKIFYDNLIDIERDEEFLKNLVSFKSSKKIVSTFVRYLEKSNQPIIAYKDVIFAMSYNIIENNLDSEGYIYGLNEEISKLIIGLYDEASEEKNEEMKAIANECLRIWDLMFEKRIGAARVLTFKMLDR
ncbi:MAG: hypothetical protein E7C50_01905 [Clostridium sp.]|uniref:hypothetical protein n=1 Tax=Clostridium sp. TaxID=1506 RepID=UPI0029006FF9|nr:hypothetical protein [Clostridium sp.]MDU2680616.1 hypothetical protein [Clostridium sp.]